MSDIRYNGKNVKPPRNGKTQERKASSIPLESLRRCCGYSFLPWAPTECYVSCSYSETTLVPLEWFLCFSSAFQRHADVSTGIFSYSFNCPVIQRGLKPSLRLSTKPILRYQHFVGHTWVLWNLICATISNLNANTNQACIFYLQFDYNKLRIIVSQFRLHDCVLV